MLKCVLRLVVALEFRISFAELIDVYFYWDIVILFRILWSLDVYWAFSRRCCLHRHDNSKIRNPRKEQKCKKAAIASIIGDPMFGADTPEEILKIDPSRLAKNALPRN